MIYEDEQDAHLRQGAPSLGILGSELNKDRTAKEEGLGRFVRWLVGVGEFDTNDPCDPVDVHLWTRPREPRAETHVWYRGWEVGWSRESDYWCNEGWIAYKGGCDLGAREVRSATYQACLNAIDDEEDG